MTVTPRSAARRLATVTVIVCLLTTLFVGLWGCTVSTLDVVEADLGVPSTEAALREALASPIGPIKFTKVTAATWSVDRSGLINLNHPKAIAAGLEDGLEPIEIYTYLLRHPEHGAVLIDSGLSADFATAEGSPAIGWLVKQAMGTDRLEVLTTTEALMREHALALTAVLLTHLHLDHIMGVSAVDSDTPVITGPRETNTRAFTHVATQGTTDRLLGDRILQTWRFGPEGVIDVFGDGSLWAIHAPGHTEGSTAFIARTTQGTHLMLGDVTHTAWGWRNGVEPGTYSHDQPASAVALQRLIDLANDFPELTAHPGHQSLPTQ